MDGKDGYRGEVLEKSLGQIRTFLDEIANGTRGYRTIDNLSGQVQQQYHDRFIYELLQNAHDALSPYRPASGRVAFRLDREEGAHGVLYVANDGQPFRRENLDALATLGQSSKDPREFIGNKGIGFRSVLEVCVAPEVYSCAGEPRGSFDGYCFRFSPEILAASEAPLTQLAIAGNEVRWTLGDSTEVLRELRGDAIRERCRALQISLKQEFHHLSPYLLPLPAMPTAHNLERFATDHYSTVIRLPLVSDEARVNTITLLQELRHDTIVFLDKLAALRIDDGVDERVLVRTSTSVPTHDCDDIAISTGDHTVRYWRWTHRYSDPVRLKRAAATLPATWKQADAVPLQIAVRRGAPAPAGRYYVYLPTETPTGNGALINAPFYAEINRKTLEFKPLNKLLQDASFAFLRDIVRRLAGHGEPEAQAIVDLLAPTSAETARKGPGFPHQDLREVPLILTIHGWKRAAEARSPWQLDGPILFTPDALRHHGKLAAVHAGLDDRRAQLEALLRVLGCDARPTSGELAATAAAVAADIRERDDVWEAYWCELRALLPDATRLRGHAVLLDTQRVLRAPDVDGVSIFFPPQDDSFGEVPASLRGRIAFLNAAIPLRRRADDRSEKTDIRRYLDSIVEEYRAETIFSKALATAIPFAEIRRHGPDERLCAEVLDFAVRLLKGPREAIAQIAELRRLRFPCQSFWLAPGECLFGLGWGKPRGELLYRYLNESVTETGITIYDHLLERPEDISWQGHGAWLTHYIDLLGVQDGLLPTRISDHEFRDIELQRGEAVVLPDPPPGVNAERWRRYTRAVAPNIEPPTARASTHGLGPIYHLPILDDLPAIDSDQRRIFTELLLRSLPKWPDNWQWIEIQSRSNKRRPPIKIQSYMHFALEESAWICVKDGEAPTRPAERWFIPAGDAVLRQYAHLLPLPADFVRLVQSLDPEAMVCLRGLGMPVLDDGETTSPRLTSDLLTAFAQGKIGETSHFRGQVRDAWQSFRPFEGFRLPPEIIVERGGQALAVHRPTADAPVYLPDATDLADYVASANLPVALMQPSDARRLIDHFRKLDGDRALALSELHSEIFVEGKRWSESVSPRPLRSSPLAWVETLALALLAFGREGHGTNTREFKAVLQRTERTEVAEVKGLVQRIVIPGGERVDRPMAALLAEDRTLLYDPQAPEWIERLASPISQWIGRPALTNDLLLVLSKFASEVPRNLEALMRALRFVHITPEKIAEIRGKCEDEQGNLRERLRPVVALLAPRVDWRPFAEARTEDEIKELLVKAGLVEPSPASLIEMARRTWSDIEMGQSLYDQLGSIAQLAAWNATLAGLSPPRPPVRNPNAAEQFARHARNVLGPLRAFARCICRREPSRSFVSLNGALQGSQAPPSLAESHWEVSFRDALSVLVSAFAASDLADTARAALTACADPVQLAAALQRIDGTIEPTVDPSSIFADNAAACERVFTKVQHYAVAWCLRTRVTFEPWLEDPLRLRSSLRSHLDAVGYLERWSSTAALQALAEHIRRDPEHSGLWAILERTSDLDELPAAFGLSGEDLQRAQIELDAAETRRTRSERTRLVCGIAFEMGKANLGKLWAHLAEHMDETCLTDLHPSNVASLTRMEQRSRAKASRSGSGGSQPPRLEDGVADLLGLAGEIFAFRLLQRRFGEAMVSRTAWRSSYSEHRFPGNIVNDNLGFDFEVPDADGQTIWCIEVKSTEKSNTRLILGPTEVHAARAMANDARRKFRILHVHDVLSKAPSAIFLPNPFDTDAQGLYRLDEGDLYVIYKLNTDNPDTGRRGGRAI